MVHCSKCGKEINDGMSLCLDCMNEQDSPHDIKTAEQVLDEQHPCNKKDEKSNKKGGLIKFFANNKDNIITGGKNAIIQFIVKKVIFTLLTSILGAILVLFTKSSFEDNYKDYHEEYLMEAEPVMEELCEFYSDFSDDFDINKLREAMKENEIDKKSKELLEIAYSYSSEDEEINRFHNQFVRLCEDMYDIYATFYTYSYVNDEVYSTTDKLSTDEAEFMKFPMHVSTISDAYAVYLKFSDDLEIYEEMREEMFEKYDIDEEEFEFMED